MPPAATAQGSSSREYDIDEQSPLLPPSDTADDAYKHVPALEDEADTWMGDEQETKSSWYMFMLTIGGFGLQMGWSVELSNGSPYLLSLGLNKSLLALVWIAGPLSGVVVQPYIGIKSDRCRSKWGKRRPFIIGGGLATIASLMVLAWTREIVTFFTGLFGADPKSDFVATVVMLWAVLFIYVLDFAINVIQAGLRAFAVDCAPTHQQETANAWVSRMQGIGNIFGMFCGGVSLPQVFPWLGNSQFKVLCALASISIIVTSVISCAAISERDASHNAEPAESQGLVAIFKSLWQSLFRLPKQVAQVCQVQFLAWMGWFPFLFYTSTYVGEIYVEPYFAANPDMTQDEVDALWEAGTKRGSVALLAFAIVTFTSSVVLPFLVAPTYKSPLSASLESSTSSHAASHPELMTATPASSVHRLRRASTNSRPPKVIRALKKTRAVFLTVVSNLHIPGLTLRRTWIYSHILFFICMWATFFVKSVAMATVLVGAVGVPWAITMWAPFALIADEVSKREALRRKGLRPGHITAGAASAAGLSDGVATLVVREDADEPEDAADQAGVVLGIHNCSVSAPQVVMTLAGSILFKLLQKPRGTPGDDSVAWFFRLGGICALAAAYVSTRVHEEGGGDGTTYSRVGVDEESAL